LFHQDLLFADGAFKKMRFLGYPVITVHDL